MMNKRCLSWALLVCVLAVFCAGNGLTQEIPPKEPTPQAQVGEEEGKIIPSPTNIKEGTAIYVFLGWAWLSILVLVFILRAKIKEVDRLYRIKFFSEKKE